MRKLGFSEEQIHFLRYNHGFECRILALLLAEIAANWGRLEYWLYLILYSVDPKRAEEWTRTFFQTNSRKQKEKAIRAEITSAFGADHEFGSLLDETLKDLEAVCWQRNKIVHGLWRYVSPGKFEIFPLRFDRSSKKLDDPIQLNSQMANQLLISMRHVQDKLAARAAEVMVLRSLKPNPAATKKRYHRPTPRMRRK